MKVEATKTPVTAVQMFEALRAAWQQMFGEHPRRQSLLVLTAQWAIETGHGRSMWNYNPGNVKSDRTAGDWCFYACWEILDGKKKWFYPDSPYCCFRAYPNLTEGTVDYLRELKTRYSRAWYEVIAGSPDAFVRALKAQFYFTGDVDAYAKTVVSLYRQFDASFPKETTGVAVTADLRMPVLQRGAKGVAVSALQALLNAGGTRFARLIVDGDFGQKTLNEVAVHNPGGLVDEGTWAKIVEHAQQ